MSKAQLKTIDWTIEITLERRQIKSMAQLAKFAGNIESLVKEGFPSTKGKIDWGEVRAAFRAFTEASEWDRKFQEQVNNALASDHSTVPYEKLPPEVKERAATNQKQPKRGI